MKKSILNLGKALNKVEQKSINGGKLYCSSFYPCPPGQCCLGWICGYPAPGSTDKCFPVRLEF